jgi:hypothetical protein
MFKRSVTAKAVLVGVVVDSPLVLGRDVAVVRIDGTHSVV